MINFTPQDLRNFILNQSSGVIDIVAVEGLKALKNVLDESGFSDSPYLKDYQIYSEVSKNEVSFIIELDEEALSDETKRHIRKETKSKYRINARQVSNRLEAKEFRRVYMMRPDGRPERIQGSRDARKKLKSARRFQKRGGVISEDRNSNQSEAKNSGERYVEHEMSATAPRNMEVDPSGKLRIVMQREVRNTSQGKVIFPKGMYQGIINKFLEELVGIMEVQFSKELNSIISQAYR